MITFETITYVVLGGILPALVWLYFWLREDYKHPEPRQLLLKTFLLGMLAVAVVLPYQKGVDTLLPGIPASAMILWVCGEEILKYFAAYFGGLKSREDNEPIDPLIYMITAALGFVALENMLFLFGVLDEDTFSRSTFLLTGNLRFIGASLLHVVSSGIVGVFMAFSFYKTKGRKVAFTLIGLALAIIFHTAFNLVILYWDAIGIMFAFLAVWVGVVVLLFLFERVKAIAPDRESRL